MQGLLGKKIGMTRVFASGGEQIPVTVLEVGPCVVVQRKTRARDGYEAFKVGDIVSAAIFQPGTYVDVTAITKGRGFQGVVRRHGMGGGPMSHGGHSKRRVGSIGCRTFPGNVHKGKRMPGHMGHVQVTHQNLEVVQVRAGENLVLVKGAVPGPAGGVVVVSKALKRTASGGK